MYDDVRYILKETLTSLWYSFDLELEMCMIIESCFIFKIKLDFDLMPFCTCAYAIFT